MLITIQFHVQLMSFTKLTHLIYRVPTCTTYNSEPELFLKLLVSYNCVTSAALKVML